MNCATVSGAHTSRYYNLIFFFFYNSGQCALESVGSLILARTTENGNDQLTAKVRRDCCTMGGVRTHSVSDGRARYVFRGGTGDRFWRSLGHRSLSD